MTYWLLVDILFNDPLGHDFAAWLCVSSLFVQVGDQVGLRVPKFISAEVNEILYDILSTCLMSVIYMLSKCPM